MEMAWGKGAGSIQAGIAVASVPRSYGVCLPSSQLLEGSWSLQENVSSM